MKLSPFLVGVISAQSGDYNEDYEVNYDDADRGKNKKNKQENYNTGYNTGYDSGYDNSWSGFGADSYNYGSGKAGTGTPYSATAVTCWESNNMGSDGTNTAGHHSHLDGQRDEYGWDNWHAGHDDNNNVNHVSSKGTVNVVRGVEYTGDITNGDYHSDLHMDHRLSGCIYEVTNWAYTADTYDQVHTMTYGKTGTAGFDDNNGGIYPVWWHYFNAHIVRGDTGVPALSTKAAHSLVMANPTYEGLGYLNFIVTFALPSTTDTADTDDDFNTSSDRHTDLYSNGAEFELLIFTGDDCATFSESCYKSRYGADGVDQWANIKFGVSSFPHNDLGKDFRFNLRMMHHMGEGNIVDQFDSYYFYKVNAITITFPSVVGCPIELNSATTSHKHKCMDSADTRGHQMWYDGTKTEWGTNVDVVHPKFVESLSGTSAAVLLADFPHICVDEAGSLTQTTRDWHVCGTTYTVKGLMNMYDEYAQREYGTHQELWFQFYYKYNHGETTNKATGQAAYIYNWPNMLFNAFEIVSIVGLCEEGAANYVYNSNLCTSVTPTLAKETWE